MLLICSSVLHKSTIILSPLNPVTATWKVFILVLSWFRSQEFRLMCVVCSGSHQAAAQPADLSLTSQAKAKVSLANNKQLRNSSALSHLQDSRSRNYKMSERGQEEKRYNPRDTTLKFVNRPDDLDPLPPDEGDLCLRAEMSCGHAVTPQSLTGWCRSLLDQGQFKFKCPALKEGTTQRCNKEWPYQEVRRLAVLTPQEMDYFEENLARLAAATYFEYKACPGCKTYVERKDLTNLDVECTVCQAENKSSQFCWQCLKPWKGPAPRSDRCENDGCTNLELTLLLNCKLTNLREVQGAQQVPSIRACPTCGQKVEHNKSGCKNVICPRCQKEFCFVCLKLTPECLKTSSYFDPCSAGVAPRQTSIPVWHRT